MADPYYDSVALLVTAEKPVGWSTPLVTDLSKYPLQNLAANASAVASKSVALRGEYSVEMSVAGGTKYLQYSNAIDGRFTFGLLDFTLECEVYFLPAYDDYASSIFSKTPSYLASGDFFLWREGSTKLVKFHAVSAGISLVSDAALSSGASHHIAICRQSGVTRMFIDGVMQTAVDNNTTVSIGNISDTLKVGVSGGWAMYGFIDNIRITRGVARYSANFTPTDVEAPALVVSTYVSEHALAVGDYAHATAYPVAVTRSELARIKQLLFAGDGHIVGTVKEKSLPTNKPVVRRVTLHAKKELLVIDSVMSDESGNYVFDRINPAFEFFITSFDPYKNYNAVIADSIYPTPQTY